MPPSKNDKAKVQAMQKKIEDKTFGMKNKNKSKAVQQQIAQLKSAAGINDKRADLGDQKKKAADAAINDVLFKEAVTKKELARRALEKAAAKAAKEEKQKEPDKRDIYTDSRDAKKEAQSDTMEDWDDAKLQEVVNKKKGGQGERCQTDIICKHFLEAVERRTYGWFWECPNGGDKCQYRHALPEGYVLKRDRVNEVVDEGPKLEDLIEEERKKLTTRTPVTFERLQEWLQKKKAAIAAKEAEMLEAARKQYAKGKAAGVSGRMLFQIDASLFVDDDAAGGDAYVREDSDDEDADGTAASSSAAPAGGSGASGGTNANAQSGGQSHAAASRACVSTAAVGAEPGGVSYSQNYSANAQSSSEQPPVDVSDMSLAGVDESLFLDEELPDDDDLE